VKRAAVLAGLASLALPTLGSRAAWAADATPLRLAAPPTDASAEYYYADAQGFFKKAGFDCDIAHLANGEAVTAGVIGGSLDIGVSQSISLVTAYSRGIPLTILAGSAVNSRTSESGMLFVPKSSNATSGKDLIGKTIGVQGLKGFAQFGTQAWLDKTGGDSSTVHFVEMTSSVMGRALADNRIDAAFIPEPFVSQVAKVAKKVAPPMDAIAPVFMAGAHFTTLAWAKAHPDVVRRFQALVYETAAWANKNHDRTAEILAEAARIDPETVRGAVRVSYITRRDPSLLQPMINLAAKYAGITPFPADDIFFKG
jgi:NitT/TauT family transport system substrate-binding protein